MKKCERRPPPKCSGADPIAAHLGIFAAIAATAFALPSAAADAGPNAHVRCKVIAATAEPSQLPRPVNAAPLRYPANEGQDPSTFKAPAAVFAKLGLSEKTSQLRLESCKLERWFQSSVARSGVLYFIDPRRMVYEIVTTFDYYEGHGGTWGPGFRTFVVDAATGDGIAATTGGHRLRSSRPYVPQR